MKTYDLSNPASCDSCGVFMSTADAIAATHPDGYVECDACTEERWDRADPNYTPPETILSGTGRNTDTPWAVTIECASCPATYGLETAFLPYDDGLCDDCRHANIAHTGSLITATRLMHEHLPWLGWLGAFRRVVFFRISE